MGLGRQHMGGVLLLQGLAHGLHAARLRHHEHRVLLQARHGAHQRDGEVLRVRRPRRPHQRQVQAENRVRGQLELLRDARRRVIHLLLRQVLALRWTSRRTLTFSRRPSE